MFQESSFEDGAPIDSYDELNSSVKADNIRYRWNTRGTGLRY
jgi:hypothetical protein